MWWSRATRFNWRYLATLAALTAVAAAAVSAECDDDADLFTEADGILPLNLTDLPATINAKSKVNWLLLLYSSYNGYSIEYAEEFRRFAFSTVRWRHTLRIAAVNAARPWNADVMRELRLRGLPALLFVKLRTWYNASSVLLMPRDTELLYSGVFGELERFVPQLKPVGAVNRYLRLHRRRKGSSRVIFLEELEGEISRRVIMNFLKVTGVNIVWRVSNQLKVGEVRFAEFRSIGNFRHKLARQWRSVESLPNLLSHLEPMVLGKKMRKLKMPEPIAYCTPAADEVKPSQEDLLSSVSEILSDQCADHWSSMVSFVHILAESLSDYRPKLRPLRRLAGMLPQSTPSSEEWLQLLKDSGMPAQPPDKWKTCKGEDQQQCGVWLLLHTLVAVSSTPVLRGVSEFFQLCGDPLDASIELQRLADGPDEVMALWRLHNSKRQSQFPSDALCPGCLLSDEDTREFLYRWYGDRRKTTSAQMYKEEEEEEEPVISRQSQSDFCDSVPQLPPVQATLLLLLLPSLLLLLRCLLRTRTRSIYRT